MVNHLLKVVDTSGIPETLLQKISTSFAQKVSEIMKSGEISDVISKIQNLSTLYTYILFFYKQEGKEKYFSLDEVFELAKMFPYRFQKQQFEPFVRILKSPLDFQEKLKRIRELFDLEVNVNLAQAAKIITLCDDFEERLKKVKKIQEHHEISGEELWLIFRGKGVSIYTLNLLMTNLQRYDCKGVSLHQISLLPDNFNDGIEERKELFQRLGNIISHDDIHRICSNIQVETEYLEQLVEAFLEQNKRPETGEQREDVVAEFIYCSNAKNYRDFRPNPWEDTEF